MQNRRSFFSRLGALVAVVAMAPEIAFAARLQFSPSQKLDLYELFDNLYSIMRARGRPGRPDEITIYTDRIGMEVAEREFQEMVNRYTEGPPLSWPDSRKPLVGIYEQLRECARS